MFHARHHDATSERQAACRRYRCHIAAMRAAFSDYFFDMPRATQALPTIDYARLMLLMFSCRRLERRLREDIDTLAFDIAALMPRAAPTRCRRITPRAFA